MSCPLPWCITTGRPVSAITAQSGSQSLWLYSGVPTSGSMSAPRPMPTARSTSAIASSTLHVGMTAAQRKRPERDSSRSWIQSL